MVDDHAGRCEGRCQRPYPCSGIMYERQTCKHATTRCCHADACVTRPPRLGRRMHGGKSEAKRERPFRATLLFAMRSVLSWQSGLARKEGLLCFTICVQKKKKQGHITATCPRRNTLNKGPLCMAIFSFSGQNHCQGTFVPQWLVHIAPPYFIAKQCVRLNGLALRTAQC